MPTWVKNCLVTGGAGFIGSHLVRRLLKDGNRVVVIDDLTEGKLENLPKNKNLVFYKKSILDDVSQHFKGVDSVFHLAALSRLEYSIKNPKTSNRVNVEGTLNVLLACKDQNVRRLVFASSASIYGDQKKYPTREDAPAKPVTPYSLQKLIGEQYCQLFGQLYGLEANCLRFYNVYGKRMNAIGENANLIPSVIYHLKNNKPATIYGDGETIRDFIYVDDIVAGLIAASESKIFGEVINLGYSKNISVNDVYRTIAIKMGKDIKPIHKPARIEPRVTLADTQKAKKL